MTSFACSSFRRSDGFPRLRQPQVGCTVAIPFALLCLSLCNCSGAETSSFRSISAGAGKQALYVCTYCGAHLENHQVQLSLLPRPSELNSFLDINQHVWGASPDGTSSIGGSGAAGTTGSAGARLVGDAISGISSEGMARLERGEVGVDDFELLKVLGKGSFGKVFLVRLLLTGDLFAMKVLKKSEVMRRRQVEHTKAERRIMGGIDHPFIVSLRFAFHTTDKLYMVTDYCKGGELFFHLKKFRVFPEQMVRFFAAELVCAIGHLHSLDVVYRYAKTFQSGGSHGSHHNAHDAVISNPKTCCWMMKAISISQTSVLAKMKSATRVALQLSAVRLVTCTCKVVPCHSYVPPSRHS
jgi:hypothetical protein